MGCLTSKKKGKGFYFFSVERGAKGVERKEESVKRRAYQKNRAESVEKKRKVEIEKHKPHNVKLKLIMKTTFGFFGIITLLLLCLLGCEDNRPAKAKVDANITVWADTIIYDVLISNPDALDEWATTKVKDVRHKKMVDDLFDMIYSGKKKVYDYYTNEEMSIADIKEMEADERFPRNRVGKLQFTETWLYDKNTSELKKQIHSILLAYELYNDSNQLRGYKAAFYLKPCDGSGF